MNVIEIIQLGRQYKALWPKQPELANYFEEYQAIQFARLVNRTFPYAAIVVFGLQLYFAGLTTLPLAIFYGLFIGSMPVQGLVMLGLKADKFLPPTLENWYREGVVKMNQQGGDSKLSLPLSQHKPRYLDLAKLLNISYQRSRF